MQSIRAFARTRFGRPLLILIAVGIVGFIVIQFIPVERTNPPVVREPTWDTPQTRALVERTCMDCHSNSTRWPWYSYIAPMSWLVTHDVNTARTFVNFSRWDSDEWDLAQVIKMVETRQMPPRRYLLLHPEANLSDADHKALLDGLNTTFFGAP